MLVPSGIGNVPTLNVRLDVWDHVESYTIRMLLACRLKIISSPNLKLIISFLVLPLVLLHHYQSVSFVASTRHASLTSCVYLRLAIRPSAQFANLLTRMTSKQQGPVLPFFKSRKCISCTSLHHGVLRARSTVVFFLLFAQHKKPRKITTDELHTRTKFQWFLNEAPRSSFKKLIISTPFYYKVYI
jgi:hypothetical protein